MLLAASVIAWMGPKTVFHNHHTMTTEARMATARPPKNPMKEKRAIDLALSLATLMAPSLIS